MSYLSRSELMRLIRMARRSGQRPDPYVRIALAMEDGVGVHLSPEDIKVMQGDDAILMAAISAYHDHIART